MNYIGENLLPGQLGHLCAVLSFVAALLSAIAYFFATQRRDRPESEGWRNLGRFSYLLHGLATFGVIAALFYILVDKRYEYQYAWANVSNDLPFQYTFSAFWKDQQGSFLLWSFWNIGLGVVLMVRAGKWEGPVLAVIALAEVFIASMLLGLYVGDTRFGASAFDLLRDTTDAPIFSQGDYLSKITGNGLNPLLQNYWMTIHPPTLFLGFASTIVPFAYAVAGLWLREHREWLKPVLPWTLFSAAILGTGILMGAAWAYVALSFGGFWAWDPVENTSLVPWIVLIAGLHTNLVARSTGYSIRSTYGLYLLTFVLVLYSTYLTRSGILGDSSAHAFTEMGLGLQLVLFIGAFSLIGAVLWVARYRAVPAPEKEEASGAREFWMFIGSLVLLFSAVLITGTTSLPVASKIMQYFQPGHPGWTITDPVGHHNRYQLWIAVFVALLSGASQFLRYSERNWKGNVPKFFKHILIALGVALILTVLNALWINARAWQYLLLLFASMFAVTSNIDYIAAYIRGNLKLAASAVSHLGFGILVLGVLSTGLNKDFISVNRFAMDGLIEGAGSDAANKNVMLLRDAPMTMRDGYEATYTTDTIERQTRTFKVEFQRRDSTGAYTGERFVLEPNVMYDRQFTKVVASNPSTKHFWNRDIFTHVAALSKAELDPEFAKAQEDSLDYEQYDALVGDTIFTRENYLVVESLTKQPDHRDYHPMPGDIAFGLNLVAHSLTDTQSYRAQPILYLRPGQGGFQLPASVGPLKMKIRLTEAALERIFKTEEELKFTTFQVREGDHFKFQGYDVHFVGAEREVKHPHYTPEPDDVAVGARLDVTAPDGRNATATPVFLIRGRETFSLKDELPAWGLHFRFETVDPQTGTLTIGAALASEEQRKLPVEIAENAQRTDYIVLEAIVFPGINYVWLGWILVIVGLALALFVRRQGGSSTR